MPSICARDGAHIWVPNSDEEESYIKWKIGGSFSWGYALGYQSRECSLSPNYFTTGFFFSF